MNCTVHVGCVLHVVGLNNHIAYIQKPQTALHSVNNVKSRSVPDRIMGRREGLAAGGVPPRPANPLQSSLTV